MFNVNINEPVKAILESEIGIFIFEELFDIDEFDIIDCFDISKEFLPPNYIISRTNYLFSSY